MRTPRLISFLLVAICVCPLIAGAQERRLYTYSGLRFDEVLTIQLGGSTLHIPAGYLAPWPQRKVRIGPNNTNSIGFNFWMPDGRFVEVDDLSISGFQPAEPGRHAPLKEQYVVRVNDLRLLKPDELNERSPETRFHNLTRGDEITLLPNEELKLLQFSFRERANAFLNYRHLNGRDPQFLLRCTLPTEPRNISIRNPVCDGHVYFSADNISFHIVLPGDHLQDLREILSTVRKLFKSWSEAQ